MTARQAWQHLQLTVLKTAIVVLSVGTVWQLNDHITGGAW
jgi:hypothetical protein